MNSNSVLNSPVEFGLRVVVLLDEFEFISLSIDEIITYDYLMTNSGEFDERYPSLHPQTPYRYSKLFVKRDFLMEGVNQMCNCGLLDIAYNKNGICYTKNQFTKYFLSNLTSNYKKKLVERAKWIANEVYLDKENNIINELYKRISTYGIEFYRER